jgi:hypothetical protein
MKVMNTCTTLLIESQEALSDSNVASQRDLRPIKQLGGRTEQNSHYTSRTVMNIHKMLSIEFDKASNAIQTSHREEICTNESPGSQELKHSLQCKLWTAVRNVTGQRVKR